MTASAVVEGRDNARRDVLMRLRRAEGQVRGLQRQIDATPRASTFSLNCWPPPVRWKVQRFC